MPSTDSAIREAVESFVEKLRTLIQESALESVQAALNHERPATRARAGRIANGNTEKLRAKGAKRTPEELEALLKKLHAYIGKAPGQRIEQIGSALAISTKELVLPIKKLIGDKRISKKGQKRATTYWAK
jgi:ribosome-associated translation inhibitor RaiA